MKKLKFVSITVLLALVFISCKKDEDIKPTAPTPTPAATSSTYTIKVFSTTSSVDNVSMFLHLLTDSTDILQYTDVPTPTVFNTSGVNASGLTVYDVSSTGISYTFIQDDYLGFTFCCLKDAYQLNGYSVKIEFYKNGVLIPDADNGLVLTDMLDSYTYVYRFGVLSRI